MRWMGRQYTFNRATYSPMETKNMSTVVDGPSTGAHCFRNPLVLKPNTEYVVKQSKPAHDREAMHGTLLEAMTGVVDTPEALGC